MSSVMGHRLLHRHSTTRRLLHAAAGPSARSAARAAGPGRGALAGCGAAKKKANVASVAAQYQKTAVEAEPAYGGAVLEDTDEMDLTTWSNGRLSWYRALVLDVSYRPVDVVAWHRAVVLDLFGKVEVLEYYDKFIRSPKEVHFLPAVLRLDIYVSNKNNKFGKVPPNRRNIYLRDDHSCQYCGKKTELTLDHVVPVSRGGTSDWDNLVTACAKCNHSKGDKLLKDTGLKLKKPPREPSPKEIARLFSRQGFQNTPEEWQAYVGHMNFYYMQGPDGPYKRTNSRIRGSRR